MRRSAVLGLCGLVAVAAGPVTGGAAPRPSDPGSPPRGAPREAAEAPAEARPPSPRPPAPPGATASPAPAPGRPAPPRSAAPRAHTDEELLGQLEREVDAAPKPRPGGAGTPAAASTGGRFQRFLQSLNPDISAIGSLAGAYYYDHALRGKGNLVPPGGHDPGKTGFHLQEIEVAFQAAVDPYLRFDSFFSFSLAGVHVEEAYFSSLGLPGGFQLRAGELYHRFGRFNEQHLHTWQFADAVLPAARLLGSEGLGSVAGEVSWLPPLPWFVMLSAAVTTPEGSPSFVGEGRRKAGFHLRDPRHLLYVFHLRQFWELSGDWGMQLGLSYAIGPNASGGHVLNMTQLLGADLFLKWRPLRRPYTEVQLTAEVYGRLLQVPEATLRDWGAYAQVVLRMTMRWRLALRYDAVLIDDVASLLRFEFADPGTDPEQPRPLDDQQRGSLALTWQPTHFSQLRLQYNLDWARRWDAVRGSGRFRPTHAVLFQLSGNIGAHGAHPY